MKIIKNIKKITAILIVLTLCAGLLAACNTPQGKDAYDLYQKMNQAMADVKSLDMGISAAVDMTISGETINTTSNGNIKQVIHSATDFDMEMNITASASGVDTSVIGYYTGGVFYYDMQGMKIKTAMSVEEAMQQSGKVEFLDFPEDAIKDFKISDADGGKKLEVTLDGKAVKNLTDEALASMQSVYPGISAENLNMDIKDVICEAVIDKNDMMKSYRMMYDMTMSVEGESISMKMDTLMTVNSYNDVTVTLPGDLDSYVDFSFDY